MPWRSRCALELVVHPVGHPQQGQLPEGRQVAGPEEVGQCRIQAFGWIDVPVGQPPPQGLRGHVDELDPLRPAQHQVRHRLVRSDAGDAFHHVDQGLEVVQVDRGDHLDAGVEELVDVLPAMLVATARHVAVGQLVDQHDLGRPLQDGVHVELLELVALVLDLSPWQHL